MLFSFILAEVASIVDLLEREGTMFLISCPNCGKRDAAEFRFGGEVTQRPLADDPFIWRNYLYNRVNKAGVQTEWWYHRYGCQSWFLARRNTLNNKLLATFWPSDIDELS